MAYGIAENASLRFSQRIFPIAALLVGVIVAGCGKQPEVAQAPPADPSFARLIATDLAAVNNPAPNIQTSVPDASFTPTSEVPTASSTSIPLAGADSSSSPDATSDANANHELGTVPEKPAKPKAPPRKALYVPVVTELPPATSAADAPPVALGAVEVADGAACTIELLAGDIALPGDGRFMLQVSDSKAMGRQWEITFVDDVAEAPPAKVAELVIQSNQLMFRWSTDALLRERANFVRNCVLKVKTEGAKKYFALRKPLHESSFQVGFDSIATVSWDIPFSPDPKHVQIDLTFPEETFQASHYSPKDTLTAKKDLTWVAFGADKQHQGFRYKLDSEMQDKLTLRVTPYFKVETEPNPVKLNPSAWTHAETHAPVAVSSIEKRLTQAKTQPVSKPPSRDRNRGKSSVNNNAKTQAATKARMEKDLAEAKLAVQQFDAIKALRTAIENGGRANVRVFYEVEGEPIDLLTTSAR